MTVDAQPHKQDMPHLVFMVLVKVAYKQAAHTPPNHIPRACYTLLVMLGTLVYPLAAASLPRSMMVVYISLPTSTPYALAARAKLDMYHS